MSCLAVTIVRCALCDASARMRIRSIRRSRGSGELKGHRGGSALSREFKVGVRSPDTSATPGPGAPKSPFASPCPGLGIKANMVQLDVFSGELVDNPWATGQTAYALKVLMRSLYACAHLR